MALVDLRERNERERHGTIPGALHVPYTALDDNVSRAASCIKLGSMQRLAFFCAFGERSAMAVTAAQEAGIELGLPYRGRHRRVEEGRRVRSSTDCGQMGQRP